MKSLGNLHCLGIGIGKYIASGSQNIQSLTLHTEKFENERPIYNFCNLFL